MGNVLGDRRVPPLVGLLMADFVRWYELHRDDWLPETYAGGQYVYQLHPSDIVSRYLDAVEGHTN